MATHDFLHYFIHFIKSFVLKPHFIIFDNTPEHFPSCWWPQSLKTRLLQNIIFSCTKILYIKWRLKQYFWQWTLIICGLSVWEHEMRPRLSSQISELKNCYRSHYSKGKKERYFPHWGQNIIKDIYTSTCDFFSACSQETKQDKYFLNARV